MRLSQPRVITFWIAVALAVLGFLGKLFEIPVLTDFAFWFVFVGFVVLALGNFLKGM
jgi:hypothetical protein